jgi:hypothetical protein
MTAASPGVIAHLLRTKYYPSRDADLAPLTDIMKEESDTMQRPIFTGRVRRR